MSLAAFQPDLAHNLGSMIRIAACFHAGLEVIEPCGFPLSSKQLKQAALDYGSAETVLRHAGWQAFLASLHDRDPAPRLVLLTTGAAQSLWDFRFRPGDILLTGRETAGVTDEVAAACPAHLRIPLAPGARSLNVAVAAGIALARAAQQLGYVQ